MPNPCLQKLYLLENFAIEAFSDSQQMLDSLDNLIGPLSVSVTAAELQNSGLDVFKLNIHAIDGKKIIPPNGFGKTSQFYLPDKHLDLMLELYSCNNKPDQRFYLLEGRAELSINMESGHLELNYAPTQAQIAAIACYVPMLSELLASKNKTLLHCAALRLENRGIMIFGECGRGKSTAALAICGPESENAVLLADDACIIRPAQCETAAPEIWPLPRSFKVAENTVKLLQWPAKLPFERSESDNERRIDYKTLTNADPSQQFQPERIFILQDRTDGPSKISKLEKSDCFTELLKLNLRTRSQKDFGPAQITFKALSQLTNHCECLKLSVGKDFENLSAIVLSCV